MENNETSIKVTVELNGGRVTLEGPRDFIEGEVRRLTELIATGRDASVTPATPATPAAPTDAQGLSERAFFDEKAPQGHMEIVTVLGFFLTEHGQEEFTEADIRRAYIRANIRPPKVVAQALRDAKSKKDYVQQGSERGTYKLTDFGDRFVRFDLPRKTK